jgi:hypothetical protein
MFFLVVFGDKIVSWIPESHVGIRGSWPVQASKSHVTTRVLSVTEYKKCTKTSKIIPYWSFGDTIPVLTVARVHFCPQNFGIKYQQLGLPCFFARYFLVFTYRNIWGQLPSQPKSMPTSTPQKSTKKAP